MNQCPVDWCTTLDSHYHHHSITVLRTIYSRTASIQTPSTTPHSFKVFLYFYVLATNRLLTCFIAAESSELCCYKELYYHLLKTVFPFPLHNWISLFIQTVNNCVTSEMKHETDAHHSHNITSKTWQFITENKLNPKYSQWFSISHDCLKKFYFCDPENF